MPQRVKSLLHQYRHGAILSYFILYIIWFTYLEQTITDQSKFHIIHSRLDDFIPFVELFVIPYFLWFLYIFLTVSYFFFTSKTEFYKICAFLFIGMTICLIIYTIWPNGHRLRVDLDQLGRSNIFISIMKHLYSYDTATNVFPSIHVFNSIGACISIYKNERIQTYPWLKVATLILTIAICLSTVFLKQHSVLDIFGGIALSIFMYLVVYVPSWDKILGSTKENQLSNT